MTVDQARKYLEAEGYYPGHSSTKGITGERRDKIKAACLVLKRAGVTIDPPKPKKGA